MTLQFLEVERNQGVGAAGYAGNRRIVSGRNPTRYRHSGECRNPAARESAKLSEAQ